MPSKCKLPSPSVFRSVTQELETALNDPLPNQSQQEKLKIAFATRTFTKRQVLGEAIHKPLNISHHMNNFISVSPNLRVTHEIGFKGLLLVRAEERSGIPVNGFY